MNIQIDDLEIENNDFPKKGADGRWYLRKQQILLFKGDSKYPDKGQITLAFSDDENVRNATQTLAKGTYELMDKSFYINKNGDLSLSVKPENLRLISAIKAA